jgi:hypothetical protein
MAISTISGSSNSWVTSNTAINDIYDGQRYYSEQEHRYRQQMERERQRMYNSAYNINTDTYSGTSAQQMEEAPKPKKAAQPEYLNNKLLLLEN